MNFLPALRSRRNWIDIGNLAVIHGWFTPSGHIVTVVGYSDTVLIVHDPYGEWFAWGYRTDLSGAYLHYSDDLICRVLHDLWRLLGSLYLQVIFCLEFRDTGLIQFLFVLGFTAYLAGGM